MKLKKYLLFLVSLRFMQSLPHAAMDATRKDRQNSDNEERIRL